MEIFLQNKHPALLEIFSASPSFGTCLHGVNSAIRTKYEKRSLLDLRFDRFHEESIQWLRKNAVVRGRHGCRLTNSVQSRNLVRRIRGFVPARDITVCRGINV
jgi:hypothetical protein